MIALDTNVLVRLLLQDDDAQARSAERVVIRARRDGSSLFVGDIVLCELVWVLTRRASLSRTEIANALAQLLRTELMVFSNTATVERAVTAYRDGKGNFADYLVRENARAAEATEIVTFDRGLKGEADFRVL